MRIRSIIADRKGSTAVEFALVAGPFIWMLIGLIETALYFTTASLMAEATNVGARMVRTGQMEDAGNPEQAFRDIVCNRAAVFVPCSGIQFQVTHVTDDNFVSAASYDATFDENGNLNGQNYEDAEASSVMIVRIAYRYPFMTPLIGSLLSDGPGNTKLMLNTIVMKNEPYDF
jgi:Flp pilus assembly protein TadG